MVSNWTGPEGEAFQAVIDDFEQRYPDVSVEIEQVPFGETQAQLTQEFAQGQPPDVSVALPGIVRLFADQGLLVNLDDVWDGWLADGSYNESLREIASAPDGSAYAVYFKGNVNGLIWYTPAQLESLGVAVPTDWDTFIAAADAAVAGDIEAFAVGGKDGWPLTQWSDPLLLSVAGPEAFLALQQGEIGWDDPADRLDLRDLRPAGRGVLPRRHARHRVHRRDLCAGVRPSGLPEPGGVHQPDRTSLMR